MRLLAMRLRARFGRVPGIVRLSLRLVMLLGVLGVAIGFSLMGVFSFRRLPFELLLRLGVVRLHLADVVPRRMAGLDSAGKIRSAHC